MKKFKTFDDIVKASGKPFIIPEGLEDHEIAYRQLVLIAKILNGDWTPDFEDYNQYKYIPYFWKQNSSFVCDDCHVWWASSTDVGSRLCFKDRETAVYAAKQFIDIYKIFLG